MKTKFLLLTCAVVVLCPLSGCGDRPSPSLKELPEDSSSQVMEINSASADSEQDETKVMEYETVPPPEGGWTTQEIMNVTYLCDHRLSYPLSMEYLGENFSLSRYSGWSAKKRLIPVSLNYKGGYLANATVVKPHENIMIYNIVLFPETCQNIRDVEPFVINGIKMYDSYDAVLSALGEDNCYKNETGITYRDRETNETLYSLFFENGQLVHINVDFRFDIDLPLYQRNK